MDYGFHDKTNPAEYAKVAEEAMEYAATQENDLYGQIARMQLGKWDDVKSDIVQQAIERVNRLLIEPKQSRTMVTLSVIEIDVAEDCLKLANAGHPPMLRKVLSRF